MHGREHQRIPYSVRVKFRTASSFLVAYSLNLSRGGLFLETANMVELGTELTLQFAVPGEGPIQLRGRVTWARAEADSNGPAGIGVEFEDVVDNLGHVIDRLVAEFAGVNILLLCADDRDRNTLSRLIRSIISTAEVVGAADAEIAEKLLDSELDLVVTDVDSDSDMALAMIVMARSHGIPTVALGSTDELRAQARNAGADEVSSNPPPPSDFQRILVRTLGKPSGVHRAQ